MTISSNGQSSWIAPSISGNPVGDVLKPIPIQDGWPWSASHPGDGTTSYG